MLGDIPERLNQTRQWYLVGGVLLAGLLAGVLPLAFLNPRLTQYVENERFRAETEKQLAKGLRSPQANTSRSNALASGAGDVMGNSFRSASQPDLR